MPQLITVGQIIDQTWDHYRTKFKKIMAISAWLFLPGFISLLSLIFYPEASAMLSGQNQTAVETGSVLLWSFNNSVITPIISLWVFIMLVLFFAADWQGQKIAFNVLSKKAWKLFLSLIWVNFLIGAILIATWLLLTPGLALNLLGSFINNGALMVLGVLIMMIGLIAALILSIRWIIEFFFASYVLIVEGVKGKFALLRSKELTTNRLFPILVRIILPKLVFLIVLVAIQGILGYLLVFFISAFSGFNSDMLSKLNTVSTTLILSIGSVLATPILVLADYIIFDSLQKTFKK